MWLLPKLPSGVPALICLSRRSRVRKADVVQQGSIPSRPTIGSTWRGDSSLSCAERGRPVCSRVNRRPALTSNRRPPLTTPQRCNRQVLLESRESAWSDFDAGSPGYLVKCRCRFIPEVGIDLAEQRPVAHTAMEQLCGLDPDDLYRFGYGDGRYRCVTTSRRRP
jgi:hypothetical protein